MPESSKNSVVDFNLIAIVFLALSFVWFDIATYRRAGLIPALFLSEFVKK